MVQQITKNVLFITGVILLSGPSIQDNETQIEQDVTELVEMVPFEKVMALAMEYAISDAQVRSLLGYLSGPKFKENMVALEKSEQFSQLADVAGLYHINAYSLANKINSVLDMPPIKDDVHRRVLRGRRSPGEGVVALVKDAVANVPLEEMKEVYKYKLESNPQFKELMERILSGEVRVYIEPILESGPFQETKKDLEMLGVPLKEIQEFLEETTTEFFELDIQASKSPSYSAEGLEKSIS